MARITLVKRLAIITMFSAGLLFPAAAIIAEDKAAPVKKDSQSQCEDSLDQQADCNDVNRESKAGMFGMH